MGKRLFLLLFAGVMGLNSTPMILTATDSIEVTGLSNAGVVETVPLPEPEPESVVTEYVSPDPQIANYTVTSYSGAIEINPVGIVKTGSLIYGHNTWNLMGSLAERSVGEVFTVTEGGVAHSYRVSGVTLYEKTADNYLNHDPYLMGDLVNGAMGHSLALMTCAGQMLGGGDATHRLVVFADAV